MIQTKGRKYVRTKRWIRHVVVLHLWVALIVGCLLLSTSIHIATPRGKFLVRKLVNSFVSHEIKGALVIGQIEKLSLERAVVRDVRLYDEKKQLVGYLKSAVVYIDLTLLPFGTLHFPSISGDQGHFYLTEDAEGDPTLIKCLAPAKPSRTPGGGLKARVDVIRFHRTIVEGSFLGLTDIKLVNVQARGDLHDDKSLKIGIKTAQFEFERPFGIKPLVDDISGQIDTNWKNGVRLYVKAHHNNESIDGWINYFQATKDKTAPKKLGLKVNAVSVSAETLRQLGFEWATPFETEVNGALEITGPVRDLRLSANFLTSGGPVQIQGVLATERSLEFVVRGERVKLTRVFRRAPEVQITGQARLFVNKELGNRDKPLLDVQVQPFLWENTLIPALSADVVIAEDRFIFRSIKATQLKGTLQAKGSLTKEDDVLSLDVVADIGHLESERHLRHYVPNARGSLKGEGEIQYRIPERDLKFNGRLALENFRYGSLMAQTLDVEGSGSGPINYLSLNTKAQGKNLTIFGTQVNALQADIKGGPIQYTWNVVVSPADKVVLKVQGVAQRQDKGFVVSAPEIVLAIEQKTWRGELQNAVFNSKNNWMVPKFVLARNNERIELKGEKNSSGQTHLHADVQNFDLAALMRLSPWKDKAVSGQLDANFDWHQSEDATQWSLAGALREGTLQHVSGTQTTYYVTYDRGTLSYDISLDIAKRGSLNAFGIAQMPRPFDGLQDGLKRAYHTGQLKTAGLDLSLLRDLTTAPQNWPTGHISSHSNYQGSLDDANVVVQFDVLGVQWPTTSPIDFSGRVRYSKSQTVIESLQASDQYGVLVSAEGRLELDVAAALDEKAKLSSALAHNNWNIDLRSASRRSRFLPLPLRDWLKDDVVARASFELENKSGQMRGTGRTELRWLATPMASACGKSHRPQVVVSASFERDVLRLSLESRDRKRALAQVQASAFVPLQDWLAKGTKPALPGLDVEGKLTNVLVQDVPWLCQYASGPMHLAFRGTDWLTAHPTFSIQVRSHAIRLHYLSDPRHIAASLPVHLDLRANSDDNGNLALEGLITTALLRTLESRCGYVLSSHQHSESFSCPGFSYRYKHGACMGGTIPLAWSPGKPVPKVDLERPLSLNIDFKDAHLEPFFAILPWIQQGDGHVQGSVRVRNQGQHNQISGGIQVEEACMQVVNLGAHLSDLTGRITFNGATAYVDPKNPVRARDQGGTIKISGPMHFVGLRPDRLDFLVDMNRFPLRREGTSVAEITGLTSLRAHVTETRTDAKLQVIRLRMELPNEAQRQLQSLEQHPDVMLAHQRRVIEESKRYPYHLLIDARKPFVVQRNDFSTKIVGALDALYDDPNLYVNGYVQIVQGHFEIFGKRFAIQRGSMRFDGAKELNPTVDILATYAPRGQQSDTIIVTVSGRLQDPQVDFSSTNPALTDRAEIIAALVSGRSTSTRFYQGDVRAASEQTSSFLAGLTAGMLTLTAREELGDAIPNIAVESGRSSSQRGRIRVGWQLDDILRKRLGFMGVQGGYIEGFASTSVGGGSAENVDPSQTAAAGGVSRSVVGGLLELYFPANFVGSVIFSPPQNYGVDITWEP